MNKTFQDSRDPVAGLRAVLHLVLGVPLLLRDHILYTKHGRQVFSVYTWWRGDAVLHLVLGIPLLLRDTYFILNMAGKYSGAYTAGGMYCPSSGS